MPKLSLAERYPVLGTALPIVLLMGVVALAYANAWPNTLILDDKLFTDYQRFSDLSGISTYFVDHVWASRESEGELYRPLLFVSLGLDANLFGDWFAGYHLVNVLLHALVTLLVYYFVSEVLAAGGQEASSSAYVALLAAVLYGIHPIHTEVVNSVFNRSNMLATLGCLFGLWWLLKFLDLKPVLGWSGLFLSYIFALFSRETAIVLPGLAGVLVLIFSPGNVYERVRRCLPVLTLLLPLFAYLVMRDHALSAEGLRTVSDETGASSVIRQISPHRLLDSTALLRFASVLAEAFKVLLWPFEPRLSYPGLSRNWQWLGLGAHVGLLSLAAIRFRRGHRGLLAGLVFFYIAFLPASRLFGSDSQSPHLQQRYLYLPAVGLTIVVAYALDFLRRRFDSLLPAIPIVLFMSITMPVTWARNAEWADEITLFEADYLKGSKNSFLLRLLTAAHLRVNNFERVIEICDANRDWYRESGMFATHCASALSYSGRDEDAERAYLEGTRSRSSKALAHSNLAQHYLRQGSWDDARVQFEKAIAAEETAADKAYRIGFMLVHLYPDSREQLEKARESFVEARAIRPHWRDPQQWIDRLNAALGPATEKAANG